MSTSHSHHPSHHKRLSSKSKTWFDRVVRPFVRKHFPSVLHAWHTKVDLHLFRYIFVGLLLILFIVIVLVLSNFNRIFHSNDTYAEEQDAADLTYWMDGNKENGWTIQANGKDGEAYLAYYIQIGKKKGDLDFYDFHIDIDASRFAGGYDISDFSLNEDPAGDWYDGVARIVPSEKKGGVQLSDATLFRMTCKDQGDCPQPQIYKALLYYVEIEGDTSIENITDMGKRTLSHRDNPGSAEEEDEGKESDKRIVTPTPQGGDKTVVTPTPRPGQEEEDEDDQPEGFTCVYRQDTYGEAAAGVCGCVGDACTCDGDEEGCSGVRSEERYDWRCCKRVWQNGCEADGNKACITVPLSEGEYPGTQKHSCEVNEITQCTQNGNGEVPQQSVPTQSQSQYEQPQQQSQPQSPQQPSQDQGKQQQDVMSYSCVPRSTASPPSVPEQGGMPECFLQAEDGSFRMCGSNEECTQYGADWCYAGYCGRN